MSSHAAYCTLLIGVMAMGTAGQISGSPLPLTGFVYDANSRSLRPLLGVPGSAYAGAAVVQDLDAAWASGKGAAIGVRGGEVIVFTELETLGGREHRDSQLIVPATAVWSASGTVALLYSPALGVIQRVTVSRQVVAEPPVPVGFLGNEVTALAVGDSGEIAFFVGTSLYLLRESTPQQIATDVTEPAALTFAGEDRLYAAAGSSVLEFQIDSASGVAVKPVIEGRRLSGLSVHRKSGRLFAIDGAARQVVVYDPASGNVQEIPLERVPSTLQVLKPGSVLLLNGIENPGSPVIVLDISKEPAPLFVPIADGAGI